MVGTRVKNLRAFFLLPAFAVCLCAAADAKGLVGFKFESDRSDCLYKLGDEAVITVTATNGAGEAVKVGSARVEWNNYGRRNLGVVKEWNFAEKNPLVVRGSLDKPGFMRLRVRGKDSEGAQIGGLWGVGFEPEKIRPASARPADFDEFWENAIARFNKEVPINASMEKDEAESAKGAYDCWRLTFATVPAGRVIRGQLTVPRGKGPWPVLMNVPGAGSGSWGFTRMPGRAYLTLNVLDYPRVPNGKDDVKKLYADQNIAWGSKGGMGRTWYFEGDVTKGCEEFFYYGAILGINRAVDYVAALPFIDARDFRYSGQSQGGAFGIILAALNKHLTRAQIGEPAITDISGFLADKRQSGWPMLPEKFEGKPCYDGLMKILPYFDCAHFAPRIKIPTRWYVGFIDELCPPHAVWAGYNCLSTADKKMLNFPGLGHGVPSQLYRTAVKEVEASW
jgi:cephalosporin-C deacetylase-like acetyl esterase